jgi:hypothetical protein
MFDVALNAMGAADIVAAAAGSAAACAGAIVVLAAAAWRLGRAFAKRGMPSRLWLVPVAYAVAIGGVLLVMMVALAFMGAPGPQPWSVETIIGMVLFAGSALAPAAAALAFRAGSRRVRSWVAGQSAVTAPAAQEGA